jgi:hypothetical protein
MENVMASFKEDLLDIIINFIVNKKAARLKKAFVKNPSIVKSIEDMWSSYDKMQKNIDDYCKKYPDACKKAAEDRDKYKRLMR